MLMEEAEIEPTLTAVITVWSLEKDTETKL